MSDAIVRLLLNTSGFDSNLQRSKGKMKDFSTQGSSTSSVLKGLGGTLSKLTGGLAAAGTALKVATDAFMTSETNVDAWGRTVESAKGLYEGFLNSLNTGDISGFLNNISQIVSAAEDAYNALDELNTYKAFNQVNAARAKAGYAEALDAYKLNPTKENKEALAKANAEVIKNLREEAQKQGVAYDKALSELFAKRGLSGKELKEAVKIFKEGSSADYYNAKGQFKEYGWWESLQKGWLGTLDTFRGRNVGTTVDGVDIWKDKYGNYESTMSEAESRAFRIARALNEVNDTEINEVQKLGAQYQQLTEAIAVQDRQFNRMAGNNGKTTTTTTKTTKEEPVFTETATSMKAMKENVTVLSKKLEGLTTGSADYIEVLRELTYWQKRVKDQQTRDSDFSNFYSGKGYGQGLRVSPDSKFKPLTPEEAKEKSRVKGDIVKFKEKTDQKKEIGEVGKIVDSISQISGALKTLGVDLGSGFENTLNILNAIMTIISAIQTIQQVIESLTNGRDTAFQAYMEIMIGQMTANSYAIASNTGAEAASPFKQGGIVHAAGGIVMGRNYVDRVPATLSSGEMVLNPAQQTKLFKMANSGGGGGGNSQPYVNAETIWLGINNMGKRKGMGELVFSKRK